MRRIIIPAIAGLALVGAAACSPDEADFAGEAEDFIEDEDDDVASQLGTTFSDAECEEPADTEEGSTFTCTATAADGVVWTFTAEIDGERSFQITGGEPTEGGATEGTAATGATTATDGATTATTAAG